MARKTARGATGAQIGEAHARGMIIQGRVMVLMCKGSGAASVEDSLEAGRISRRTFYRLYTGKDDVLLAIYRMGTDRLVAECQRGLTEEPDPRRYIERFIDAHLMNTRVFARLIYLLGGEAAWGESPLHAHRMKVHEQLVDMLAQGLPDADPLILRGVLHSVEGIMRLLLEECDQGRKLTEAAVQRGRRVMLRIATGTL